MIKINLGAAILLLGCCAVTSAQSITGFVNENDLISLSALEGPVNLVGVDFKSPGGYLVPSNDPFPFGVVVAQSDTRVTLGSLGASVIVDGVVTTNVGYTGPNPLVDLDAKWGSGDSDQVREIGFPVIPEPSAICLSGLAALVLLGARRRR